MRKVLLLLMVSLVALGAMGCSEGAILAGNGASMVVAFALLWSTVNINRHGDNDGDEES